MQAKFLCVSVLGVASGPGVGLASCGGALNPPVMYSIGRSKAVVLTVCTISFYMCRDASIVVTVFNSCPLCCLFY